jgi:dipeptidyl aminopeptidase/acylaminoacyl peptidase
MHSSNGLTLGVSILVLGLTDCSSNTTATGGATGTLFLNGDTHASIYSFNLGSGATTKLVFGNDPFVTPQKTILCANTVSGDLGEYSADGTTFRTIVKKDVQSSMTYKNSFRNPQLSPDGNSVAYEGQLGYTFDIYVVDRASGQLLASQNPPTVGLGYVRPTWVPDGTLVVAGGTQNPGLYRSDATWTTFARFDQGLTTPDQPVVSPDGSKVAFVLNSHIYTVKLDGTGLTQVTTSGGAESWPAWSPDGKSLALFTDISMALVTLDGKVTDLKPLNDSFVSFTVSGGGQISWR